MEILGLRIERASKKELSPPDSRGVWWPIIRESFSGAWQKNEELSADSSLAFWAVFACHTLVCSDVAKNRIKLVQWNQGVWQEITNPAYSPFLRKPNHFQTRIQFVENWVNSKLARGNAYILKGRDGRGVVTKGYVLNPDRVQPLVSDDGQVFYRLGKDNLSEIQANDIIVPAREIIHDRFNCLFHPLVGISPLYAAALPATLGTNIQRSATRLTANGVRPSGILTAPGRIDAENAKRLKETWETQYAGSQGATKIAVLGDGLKFEALTMTGEEAQLIEQLKFTAEQICSVYHVPPFMIGIGQEPSAGGVQERTLRYYTQCIQRHFEDIEAVLDDGLGMDGVSIGTEFDVENLLRMDSLAQMETLEKGRNYLTPNEGRQRLSLPPTEGGDVVLRQQQDFSLSALAKRDAKDDPFGKEPTPKPPANEPTEMPVNDDKALAAAIEKHWEASIAA